MKPIFILLLLTLVMGCNDQSSSQEKDSSLADTDSVANTDSAGETDSAGNADSNTSPDSDINTESDTDADTNSDDDTGTGTDVDTDTGTDFDSDTFVYEGPSVQVNFTDVKQTIDMIGGDMERSSMAIQSSINKDEMIDWAFKDINFNTCRVQYDKNQELEEGTKNWDFYKKQVATMKGVKAANPNIQFFATLRTDYDGFGDENNLPDWICNYNTQALDAVKYGTFLADYVEYMNDQDVPIAIMSVSKEWAQFVPANVAEDVIITMNSVLNKRGVALPKISDQGFWSISKGITYINKVASLKSEDLYDSFCSHNYAKEGADAWQTILEKATALGKPVYNDEASTGAGGPSYGEEPSITKPIGVYIEKAITYAAGLQGEIFFEIWSRGINKETRSIYCPWQGTGRRLRGYYIMKQFANNILNSRYVTSQLEDMPDVHTIAFRLNDKIVLWVINDSTVEYTDIQFKIDGGKASGTVNVLSWTEESAIEGIPTTVLPRSGKFYTTVAAQSITSYIFNVI